MIQEKTETGAETARAGEPTNPLTLAYALDAANMGELLQAAKDGTLIQRLRDEYHFYEAEKLEALLRAPSLDDRDVILTLADLFPSIAARLTQPEKDAIASWLPLRRCLDSASESEHAQVPVAATQEDFVRALKENAEDIYLYEGEFDLPLFTDHAPVRLHGIHNPVLNIKSDTPIQLGDYKYTMDGVTLFLRRPSILAEPLPPDIQALKDAGKILSDVAESTSGREGLWSFDRIAEGRQPYASHASFQALVDALPAIAIGTVTLYGDDYDEAHQAFRVRPAVRGSFLDFWEHGSAQRDWFLPASYEDAEALMETQRKSRLFAEFDADDAGKLFIRALFLRVMGRPARYLTSTPRRAEEEMMEAASGTSGGGAGYGLDLIDIDQEERTR